MSEPTAHLQALRAATADLVKGLVETHWSDADAAEPSLLPDWSRGHVLTHIARNADGISDTLAGALRGEVVARYPGGASGRDAAIEEGARRPFAALMTDVRESAERLDRMFGAIGDAEGWSLPTEHGDPAEAWVYRRWREVEVHRVDLRSDYTPQRWQPLFVTAQLEDALSSLDERVDGAVRVEVIADGSLARDHVGRSWTFGVGEPVEVRGPDWAVLAWAMGRTEVAQSALSATPQLKPWR